MLNWISNIITGAAFEAAIYSAGVASTAGMHQPEEPESLKKAVEERKLNK